MRTQTFRRSIFAFILTLLLPVMGMAQNAVTQPTETLWTTGKIFVVLIVVGVIFAGIGLFLVILERKISRVEKSISDKNP